MENTFTLYYSGSFLWSPQKYIYIQPDGIVMGSVLGPIFSHFYMSVLENKVFNTIDKSNIYWRYSDDILLLINSTDEINTIQETFQNNSVLNFTQEININNKFPFLGVLIDTSNTDWFITSAYKKPTNINPCPFNFQSECLIGYKRKIIKTLISRANLLNMSWCARHVKTFELWMLCACLCIFSLYIFHLLLLSQQGSIAMWTILISKSWWWLLKPKH